MNQYDSEVFEYRRTKNVKFADWILREQIEGKFEKITLRTTSCGYVDAYIYRPQLDKKKFSKIVIDFHGGGFVLRYPEQEGKYCRWLAEKTGRVLISVDYPVAPEFKYPLPMIGTYEFLCDLSTISDQYCLDLSDLILIGSSAGATLAASMCVLNHHKHALSIAGLELNYGVFRQLANPSLRKVIDPSKAIANSRMEQYLRWFFSDLNKIDEPLASPIYANPSCFPKTLIIGAEYDSLLTDSIQLHDRIENSELWIAQGTMHGFTHSWFKEYDPKMSKEAWDRIANFIRKIDHK